MIISIANKYLMNLYIILSVREKRSTLCRQLQCDAKTVFLSLIVAKVCILVHVGCLYTLNNNIY